MMAPPAEHLPVAVRAYEVPTRDALGPRFRAAVLELKAPSRRTLVFDCETETDAAQRLRFGAYQLRRDGELHDEGYFFDPEALNDAERSLLEGWANATGRLVWSVADFVEHVFYPVLFERDGLCIGFNLPFDISRLAIEHDSARRSMRGGFTFKLSPKPKWPRVQVKHLNSRAALIRFAAPAEQRVPRGMRRRAIHVPVRRGYFVDVRTLASALLGASWSLGSLADHLETEARKLETDEHGVELSVDYLEYAIGDVQATWECFAALRSRYSELGLTETSLHQIYSEASIGKAYLKQIGIQPWRALQPNFAEERLGQIMASYVGGRAEVRRRRVVTRVLYCDFLSQYPTVCVLMDLWRFVSAKGIRACDATAWATRFLGEVSLANLQKQETWRRMSVLVRVRPNADIFPVRARYSDEGQFTIGLNYFTAPEGSWWFTLADCIASTLLTGRAPEVLEAIRFEPLGAQAGLRPIELFGESEYRVDPLSDDFYQRMIDLRSEVKRRRDAARAAGDSESAERLDAQQLAMKIVANATSYGCFVELNVNDLAKRRSTPYFGPEGAGTALLSSVEEPGRYFHPLLAALITGAGRLLLAIAERLTEDVGIDWAFCDTDSMALARPDGMAEAEFLERARRVQEWFTPLNPYAVKGPVFQIEDVNYGLHDGELASEIEPLYCFAVSAKRYVLFNLVDGSPVLRKASAHGLGHLLDPYDERSAPESIPSPDVPLSELGVKRWQHDLWYRIVQAALEGHPDRPRLEDIAALDQPAGARYSATTPALLRWFREYNEGKPYAEQVRPFNFLSAYQCGWLPADPQSKRPRDIRPVAPYDPVPSAEAAAAFDRLSGEAVAFGALATYRQALAQYHLRPESKFLGGEYTDRGATHRRHVRPSRALYVGKEANRWEEQFFLGPQPKTQTEYAIDRDSEDRGLSALRIGCERFRITEVAEAAGVSTDAVRAFRSGRTKASARTLSRLRAALKQLAADEREMHRCVAIMREQSARRGLRATAERFGVSPSYLSQVLNGRRLPTRALASKVRQVTNGRRPASRGPCA